MNRNLIEERAINDPEIAEYMRAEIERLEESANKQLEDTREKLIADARKEITKSAYLAAQEVEGDLVRRAYRKGKAMGFTKATLFIAVLSLGIYIVLNML